MCRNTFEVFITREQQKVSILKRIPLLISIRLYDRRIGNSTLCLLTHWQSDINTLGKGQQLIWKSYQSAALTCVWRRSSQSCWACAGRPWWLPPSSRFHRCGASRPGRGPRWTPRTAWTRWNCTEFSEQRGSSPIQPSSQSRWFPWWHKGKILLAYVIFLYPRSSW